jgi:hypothetical protein
MEQPILHVKGPEARALLPRLQRRLEQLFDDPDLQTLRRAAPAHPAVLQFDALERMWREPDGLFELHRDLLLGALRLLIDMSTWVPNDPETDVWSLVPDQATRRMLQSTLRVPDQFEDTLAELFFLGWLRGAGVPAERLDEEGVPDLVVARTADDEARVEVKRLHADTGPERIANVARKANKQIRRADPPGGGALFISLGLPMAAAPPNEAVPQAVQRYVDEAIRVTRREHRNISKLVLSWEDFFALGEPPEPLMLAVRRRSIAIEHGQAHKALVLPPQALDVGLTTVAWVRFAEGAGVQSAEDLIALLRATAVPGRGLQSAEFELNKRWRDEHGTPLPLGHTHVTQAFKNPDAVSILQVETEHAIVTRRITRPSDDFVLVVYARWDHLRAVWCVDNGYRLYGEREALDRFAGDPEAAFAEVLVRYGNRYRAGGQYLWWSRRAPLESPVDLTLVLTPQSVAAGIAKAVGVFEAPEQCLLNASISEDASGIAIHGTYWIHVDRYRAALIAASRTGP